MNKQEQIKKDLVDQLSWDNRVDANSINVKVEDSKAILTGSVITYSEKIAAGQIAWSVTGVNLVDNQLQVEFPTTFSIPSDQEIKDSIEQRLIWNISIDSSEILIDVSSGIVTLSGSVTSFWQKTSAQIEAEKASGVINVINKLAVVPTEKINDEIIGERIMERVDKNTVADVNNIDVKVKDGQVSLSGQVPTWDAWRSVYDAAQYTSGVTEVEDKLSINYA